MDVISRIRDLLSGKKSTQKRKSSFAEEFQDLNLKKIRMSELNGEYQGDPHHANSGTHLDSAPLMRNHVRRSDSFLTNNARPSFLTTTTTTFGRNRTNDQIDSNTNYNYHDDGQLNDFKHPMPPPLTNGSKRIPGLISATAHRSTFNKPQQTVNPHFNRYGEIRESSELSNFKSIPELYPINNANRSNVSHSSNRSLVNGHEHSSMFSSKNYGSLHQRPTFNNSHFLSTPRLIPNSGTSYFNNSSTKSIGLKGNAIFSSSGQVKPPANLSRSRYQSMLDMIPGLGLLKKSKKIAVNEPSVQGVIDLSEEPEVRGNKTTSSGSTIPNVERVNSLKARLETKDIFKDDWEKTLNERYSNIHLSRKDSLKQVKEENDKCERKTRDTEDKLKESLNKITISSIVYDEEEEEEPANDYPRLDPDKQIKRIYYWVSRSVSPSTVIISKFNLSITGNDISTLQWEPLTWLNDEVINFYMELLGERSRLNEKLPKVHGMNTFFLKRLLECGYSGVRRWTRKVDIFAHDIIPVPVHKGIHWCMAIIHMKNKTIKYYDSMGAPNNSALNALAEYLKAESLDKKKVEFDMSGWKMENVRNIPQQENGSDCGVFSCMYAEFVTRNRPIVFTQQHMQYFRMKMVYEICTGQMLN